MTSLAQPIIDRILDHCNHQGYSFSPTLVAFALNATILRDFADSNIDDALSSDDVSLIIHNVSSYLCDTSNIDVLTLQLQSAFHDAQKEGQDHFSTIFSKRRTNLNSLRDQISKLSVTDTMNAYTLLLQYCMSYMFLVHGTDPAKDTDVSNALESVLPRGEMSSFLSLSPSTRTAQLDELSEIVHGISLLNAKEELLSAQGMANETINNCISTLNLLKKSKSGAEFTVSNLLEIITFFTRNNMNTSNKGGIDRIVSEHVFGSQFLTYLDYLIDDVTELKKTVDQSFYSLKTEVAEIVDLIGRKTAVPKKDVYPKFISLSKCFNLLFKEKTALRVVGMIFYKINDVYSKFESLMDSDDLKISHRDSNFEGDPVQEYIPSLGTIVKKDEVLDKRHLALSRPCLVSFVGSEELNTPELSMETEILKGDNSTVVDQDCQTPLHFVEKHIDYNYEFSEWKLRQRALKLANLLNKKTSSMQTTDSAFKRDQESQIYLTKNRNMQTNHDQSTNTGQLKTFYSGLVGRPEIKPKVVNLELKFD
ncbi:hypothetical protein P9112_013354 [Eukaryota sp. TZLM1-RC]